MPRLYLVKILAISWVVEGSFYILLGLFLVEIVLMIFDASIVIKHL